MIALGKECCKDLAKENLETKSLAFEFDQIKSSQDLLLVLEERALLWRGWEVTSGKSVANYQDLRVLKSQLFKKRLFMWTVFCFTEPILLLGKLGL